MQQKSWWHSLVSSYAQFSIQILPFFAVIALFGSQSLLISVKNMIDIKNDITVVKICFFRFFFFLVSTKDFLFFSSPSIASLDRKHTDYNRFSKQHEQTFPEGKKKKKRKLAACHTCTLRWMPCTSEAFERKGCIQRIATNHPWASYPGASLWSMEWRDTKHVPSPHVWALDNGGGTGDASHVRGGPHVVRSYTTARVAAVGQQSHDNPTPVSRDRWRPPGRVGRRRCIVSWTHVLRSW